MPFKIIRNDLTKMNVDAIVNTANMEPMYSYGLDTAVYEAAGVARLLEARRKIGRLKEGEAAITKGFALPAKNIIHAVSPVYYDGTRGEEQKLQSCYENSLKLAKKHHCKSIAFPLIATGNFGYPKAEGLEVALQVIRKFLIKNEMMVYLVLFDEEAVCLSGKLFHDIESYIDKNYVVEKTKQEYRLFSTTKPLRQESARREKPESDGLRRRNASTGYCILEDKQYADSIEKAAKLPDFLGKTESMGLPNADMMGSATVPVPEISSAQKRSLEKLGLQIGETFQERLLRLIDEKGFTDVQAYKKAGKDKKLFHKIRSNKEYQPSKHTVFAFALALELSMDEAIDLLASAGFAFSPSSRFDLIIRYAIEQKLYDLYKIDCILYDFGEEQYFTCEF